MINVLIQCKYANNTAYNFIYGDWGIVSEIDQLSATGALRSYSKYNFPAAATALSDTPTYTTKTVFDGVNTASWNYAGTKSGLLVSAMAVTDSAGVTTTTNLYTSGWQTGLVYYVTRSNGATNYRTTTNSWSYESTSLSYALNPRIDSVSTTLNDSGQSSAVNYTYTANGNVSQVQEFDYGGLARTTQTDYLTTSAYLTQHILDRPSQVRVYNAAGTLLARTDFAYDSGVLMTVAPSSGHDNAAYGSAFTSRGNPATVTRYPNLPSTTPSIVRNFSFDTAGNLLIAQVDCCNLEQWTFGSETQYAYPASTIRGPGGAPQLTTTMVYDFDI